jgi:class 3 adenylate cyclase
MDSAQGYLVIHPGTPDQFRVEFEEGKVLEIGRKANPANPCRVVLSAPEVSGNHAEIRQAPEGWTIRDLGSTNGTRLNGDWITPGQEYLLKNGDVIKIAQIDLQVNLPNDNGNATGASRRIQPVEDEHEKTQFHIKLINATILVGDIRAFTTLMEAYSSKPEVVMQAAQRVFQNLTDEIRKQHGQVEKVAGDAIMAYWQSGDGAAASANTYALDACRSALRMRNLVREIAQRKDAWPFPDHPLQVDVALATGPVAAGVLGASKANPALLGDTANLAFRLEKLIGDDMAGECIIDGATYELVKAEFETQSLGSYTVKGRQRPVEVYRLVSAK